ncbi:LytR/AlgR family response regulator transcription factor [Emticicia sp. 17c]|uniref:LytR/AlgR family response regulator transcription factor n=1 Tax=Emticicia sp. 17c TaxID=3127704 RepID=UPI00301BA467
MDTNIELKIARNKSIPITEVLYLQASENYTIFNLMANQKTIAAITLKHYENILSDKGFIRPNRSFIIRTDFIQSINFHSKTIILKDTQIIQVSRKKFPLLLPIFRDIDSNNNKIGI